MKHFLFYTLFLLVSYSVVAQNDFIGVAKYNMTVEGSNNPVIDSMTVIFGKQKVKVILYLPGLKTDGPVLEKIFIDDFSTKKSIVLNTDKTYRTDTLNTNGKYDFINTGKIAAANDLLCFQYKADSTKFDRSLILSAVCLASIDYRNSYINKYFFLGIQPIITDNRIVMDFVIAQPGGIKQRIYISEIKRLENADSYFNLDGYKQVK